MKRFSSNIAKLLSLVAVVLLSGCIHRGPRSAYRDFYQSRFADVRVPTYEEMASVDGEESTLISLPSHKVWDACLDLAAQSKGILGVVNDGSGHRLLLISGKYLKYKLDRWVFVDRWLGISIRPIAENSTEVRIAFVSPRTARVASFAADNFPTGFKGDRQRSISFSTKETFISALKKTFTEEDYVRRLSGTSRPTRRSLLPTIAVKEMAKHESIAQRFGNFQSASIRRERFVLNMPRLEEEISEIIRNISRAANQSSQVTRVFVVADVSDATHAEPNGDIFIATETLDTVKDVDELAGIISHELAHLYLHHGARRTGAIKHAGLSRNAITFIGMLGGAVAGGLLPTSKPHSVEQPDRPQNTLLSIRDILIGAGVGYGAMHFGGQIGVTLGVGVGGFTIQRFSLKEELEADEYGAELLWAAGYDYRGLLRLLQRRGIDHLFEIKANEQP